MKQKTSVYWRVKQLKEIKVSFKTTFQPNVTLKRKWEKWQNQQSRMENGKMKNGKSRMKNQESRIKNQGSSDTFWLSTRGKKSMSIRWYIAVVMQNLNLELDERIHLRRKEKKIMMGVSGKAKNNWKFEARVTFTWKKLKVKKRRKVEPIVPCLSLDFIWCDPPSISAN